MNQNKTKLEQAFSLFCSKDEMRPEMLTPFPLGGNIYATDGYTLIRVLDSNVDFDYEKKETTLLVLKAIPEINTSEIINIDAIDWSALMTKDETILEGKDVECGHCKGEGIVEDDFIYKGKTYNYEYDCPVCDGSGYEEEKRKIPTGNKTFGDYDVVIFKGIAFYATKFYKLKEVKDLLGGDVELISQNGEARAVMFRIGIAEIIIMPCMLDRTIDNEVAKIK